MARRVLYLSVLSSVLFLINNGSVQAAPTNATDTNRPQNNRAFLPETRIIGGETAQEGQFPWQAAVVIDINSFCGGSIIGPTWILTAGHCTYGSILFAITVGTIYSAPPPKSALEPNRQTVLSVIGIPHPFYRPFAIEDDYDIGLIRLSKPLVFSDFVNAIALPTSDPEYLNLDFETARISGWGKTSDNADLNYVLKYTDLTIIPGKECAVKYGDTRMDQKICCSTESGHSTCNGDSGGPLIYRPKNGTTYREVGIVSYGAASCTKEIPVVFTRVTSYIDYIEEITGITGESSTQSSGENSTGTQSSSSIAIAIGWLRKH